MWRRKSESFADSAQVYDKALDLLELREHGRQDMYEKLLLKGASEEQAREVVERLVAAGLIDELRYGLGVYRSWEAKGCYGRQHLIGTLTKKLVGKEVWPQILEQFTPEMEEEHAGVAADLFHKKYQHKEFEDKRKLWATAAAFMVNRGFGSDYMGLILERFVS